MAEEAKLRKRFTRDVKNELDGIAKTFCPNKATMNFPEFYVLPNENIYYEATIRTGEIFRVR